MEWSREESMVAPVASEHFADGRHDLIGLEPHFVYSSSFPTAKIASTPSLTIPRGYMAGPSLVLMLTKATDLLSLIVFSIFTLFYPSTRHYHLLAIG